MIRAEGRADRALITRTVARVGSVGGSSTAAARHAQDVLDQKAKPRGSLGQVEELACRIAGIRGGTPTILTPAIVVCAADHGLADEGVSAYPSEVTGQMLRTFVEGGAAVCVLAREAGARLIVADLGVHAPTTHPAVLERRVRAGTANAVRGPAMTVAEAERAVATGIEVATDLVDQGVTTIALGEMGIANTTAAAALVAALLQLDAAAVCGPGTGVGDAGIQHKVTTVRKVLANNRVEPGEPMDTLAAVGGLEIAALVGVTLAGAAHRVPVLVDGFITGVAALVATRLAPHCGQALIAAHRSPEPGHDVVLDALGLRPLLDLGLRLGEGSGAALALPLMSTAMAITRDMATFAAARVTDAGA